MVRAKESLMRIAPPDTQLELMHVVPTINCRCSASARNAYGTAAQYLVERLLGLQPIRINGTFEACFDCFLAGTYYEVKSVRAGQKVVMYESRIRKDEESEVLLKYVILIHSIRYVRKDVIGVMTANPVKLLVVSSETVHRLARRYSLNVPKGDYSSKKVGYQRPGYAEGYYNLPVSELERCTEFTEALANPFGEGRIELLHEKQETEF